MNTTKGQIARKDKEDSVFVADSLDNTAPPQKILEEIQRKHGPAHTFYSHVLKPRNTEISTHIMNYHFALPGHPLNAFSEHWDGELNTGYFEAFTYKSTLPKFITPVVNTDKVDPVMDILKKKNDWHTKFNFTHKTITTTRNLMQKYEVLNEEVVRCPKYFVDVAEFIDKDPDPYFDEVYNWYYAGHGNMQVICINWLDYLLHSKFSYLYLTRFYKEDVTVATEHAATFDCGDDNILETVYSSLNLVAIRTKHKVFILKIVDSVDKISLEKIKLMESKLPFVSISFDGYHKNMLYVTTLDNNLTIVNIDRLKGRNVKLRSKKLLNNWATVIGAERGYYTHVGTNSIRVYDKRTNNMEHGWKNVTKLTDEIRCGEISVAKQCGGAPSLYFASNHHLFHMDMRYNTNSRLKVVQRWTHGMQCMPTYMSMVNYEFNKELICLSSQWSEDMCVVSNYNNTATRDYELSGIMIPYRPPSILTTLSEARENRLCCDIDNPVDGRLTTAITGLALVELRETCAILMQNSFGDITKHTLYPEHMSLLIKDDSVESLNEWSKSYKVPTKEFEVTDIANIAGLWKQLRKVPKDVNLGEVVSAARKCPCDEAEITDAFDNGHLDSGLQDVWTKDQDHQQTEDIDQSSLALNLHYSDSDE